MQKSLFFQISKGYYLIPILLFVSSFVIYSYNLEGQPSFGDEFLYLSWGGVFFDSLKEGDLNNPCVKNIEGCELLYFPKGKLGGAFDIAGAFDINYTPIRNFFVGFSQYLTTGENKGDFYEWSCKWTPCWDDEYIPSREELSSGRFFSAIFGSLTIVVAFFVGKTLFNRTTGLFFSLILLFYSLWLVNSRLIMSEVYLYFFLLLSIFLLLKSFKKENNHRKLFFILGAISFGIALNIKLFAIELVIPILAMILFYDSFNEKLNFKFFKNRKNILKVISLTLIFFVISSISFVATFPRYYDDTLNQITEIRQGSYFVFASFPTAEKNYLYRTLVTLQAVLLPYLMDPFVYDVFPDEAEKMMLIQIRGDPQNFSTIPLSLFFFIGLIYMIRKIKTGNLKFSEFVLLVWFTSVFIFITLFVDRPFVERYYLPLMFPIILIASYALWKFIKQIQNQKEKILFFLSFIIAHSLYIITFFDTIYFSSSMLVNNPLPFSSQLSLIEPLVYVSSIIFVVIFVIVYLRTKTHFVNSKLVLKKV